MIQWGKQKTGKSGDEFDFKTLVTKDTKRQSLKDKKQTER